MERENDLPENSKTNKAKNKDMEELGKMGKGVSRIRLANAQEIRKFIAKIIRDVNQDNIPHDKARLLMLLSEALLKAYRLDEVEKRMMELEQTITERNEADHLDNDSDNFFLKKVK